MRTGIKASHTACNSMRNWVWPGLACAVFLWQTVIAAGTAPAALLNLGTRPPDIFSHFIYVEYDAGSGRFQANGEAWTLDMDGNGPDPVHNIDSGYLSIDITLDQDTGEVIGGPGITVTGTVADLGFTSNTLLTGDYWQFGFVETGGEIFEFKFHPTGGDLDPYFTRNKIGVVLHAEATDFQGDFHSSFNNEFMDPESPLYPSYFGVGYADTFHANPEPSTLLMFALAGGAGLARSRIVRKRRRLAQDREIPAVKET